jgi:hypothetical protein
MNTEKGESNVGVAGKTAIRLTKIMISSLVSKVNPSHPADLALHRDYSVAQAPAKDWGLGTFLMRLVQY